MGHVRVHDKCPKESTELVVDSRTGQDWAVAGGRCWRSTPPWEGFRNRHTGVGNSKASCMLCAVVAGATVECLSSTRTRWRIVCSAARAAAVLVQA
jgi:hypothetical protein